MEERERTYVVSKTENDGLSGDHYDFYKKLMKPNRPHIAAIFSAFAALHYHCNCLQSGVVRPDIDTGVEAIMG